MTRKHRRSLKAMRLKAKSLSKGQDTLDQEEDDDGEKAELLKKVAKKLKE